jgi:tryptophan-rich sensory protein
MSQKRSSHQLGGLLGWLGACALAAAAGAMASVDAGAFYQQLSLPAWAPPGWLFAPVWTLLYALMGVSAWLVRRAHGFQRARLALALFIIQLVMNALWTWIFFAWMLGAVALVEILVLWCLIVATAMAFRRLHAMAALLLLPYLAWVTFAALLTFATWRLNPGVL